MSNKETTLECLLAGIDQRGLLVLQVLLGQQAMKILSEEHIETVTKAKVKSKLLLPSN